ncbi:MAG: SemiSWEET transporter [Endomicrobium sp.]|jgi:MtN3 and saliva related transmembrane protein|nr:SemiSWEET transporter [Endomicrobium sp.]
MFSFELLGFFAGALTTSAFIPQVYKTWKTKSAKDVSMPMFLIFAAGTAAWIIYGFVFWKPPIFVSNLIILMLAAWQIILKIKYDRAQALNKKGE